MWKVLVAILATFCGISVFSEECYRKVLQPNGITRFEGVSCQEGSFQSSTPPVQAKRWSPADGPNYFGANRKAASFNFQAMEMSSFLRVLSDFSGLRFFLDDQVTTSVSLRMADEPWPNALIVLLRVHGLAVIKVQKGLYVFPLEMSDQAAIQRAITKGL